MPITASELFEVIKDGPCPSYNVAGNPLIELAHIIKLFTSKTRGIITQTELSAIKAFLEREGKSGKNRFNLFYEDLSIYLDQKYPLDFSKITDLTCVICQSEINPYSKPLILSCNHIFCYNCLFEWYTRHNLKKEDAHELCPTCRAKLDSSIITLFISDDKYKEKSDAVMEEYEEEALQEIIIQIIFLSRILQSREQS